MEFSCHAASRAVSESPGQLAVAWTLVPNAKLGDLASTALLQVPNEHAVRAE